MASSFIVVRHTCFKSSLVLNVLPQHTILSAIKHVQDGALFERVANEHAEYAGPKPQLSTSTASVVRPVLAVRQSVTFDSPDLIHSTYRHLTWHLNGCSCDVIPGGMMMSSVRELRSSRFTELVTGHRNQ